MKIALDAMGGDLAPKAAIEGALLAARELGLELVLVGDRTLIQKELDDHDTSALRLRIEHAAEVVAMDDSPIESILAQTNTSIHAGYELLKRGEVAAFVSAGNSGALMTGAMAILGTLPGVDRPAIGSMVPTGSGLALLIDAGANTDVKPFNLVQFAVMGTAYARALMGVARPRIGILANGEEDSKGTDITREAAATLAAMAPEINYIGYVEGRDINRGKADVVVTDGFTGNIALKTMEGLASLLMGNLRELFIGGMRGRLAYLLLRKRIGAMRERMDPTEYGGSPLLGVSGVAIVAHGSSNPRAIRSALRVAANEAAATHINDEIVELLAKIPMRGALPKPAGTGIRALFSKMRERLHRHPKEEREGDSSGEHQSRGAPSAGASSGSQINFHPALTPNGIAPVRASHDSQPDRASESGEPPPSHKAEHS